MIDIQEGEFPNTLAAQPTTNDFHVRGGKPRSIRSLLMNFLSWVLDLLADRLLGKLAMPIAGDDICGFEECN